MFKNLSEFQQAICDYLRDIIECNENIIPVHYEEFVEDTLLVIEACVKENYIANVDIWHDENGNIHAENLGNLYVTLDGYKFINFLENNESLKIAKKADKRARLSSFISIIAMFISAITLCVEFFSNYKEIIASLNSFFSRFP